MCACVGFVISLCGCVCVCVCVCVCGICNVWVCVCVGVCISLCVCVSECVLCVWLFFNTFIYHHAPVLMCNTTCIVLNFTCYDLSCLSTF